jgi:hypothetical protein
VLEHTSEAVPAIVTGKYPRNGQLPLVSDHPDNLFTLLGGSYRLRVFEPVTQLCGEPFCRRERAPLARRLESLGSDLGVLYLHIILPERLSGGLPSVTETWQGFGDDHGEGETPEQTRAFIADVRDVNHVIGRELWRNQQFQFERFLTSLIPSPRPTLYFLHILLPHSPWRFLPSGRQYGNALGIEGVAADVWSDDRWLVAHAYQRHLLQVGFVDHLLGKLLRRLRARRLYDRSLVVVTADHGISFRPGDRRRGVTRTNVQDIASVPLFIKQPGQRRGRVVDVEALTIDILPTIADILDIPPPWKADGRSLFAGSLPERPRLVVFKRTDAKVVASAASVRSRKYATLRRKIALFGSGRGGSLFAIGRRRTLLGRRVERMPIVEPTDVELEIDGESLLQSVNPRSALAPSYITGTVGGDGARSGLELAVALNGRIAAVGRTFRSGGALRFSAFVPESAFRPGRNRVDVFLVSGRAGALALRGAGPRGSRMSYRLEQGQAGEIIRSSAGEVIRVRPGALRGRLEDWFFEKESVRFGGWAADVAGRRLPEKVLVFSSGRFLYSGTPSVERRDLPFARADRSLSRSGFVFELPRKLLGDRTTELRFFALRGNLASELTYHGAFPWRTRR